jgi:Flp pilus assembly protein TadG
MEVSSSQITIQRGAAALEAALLLPILILIVSGLIDAGFVLKRSTTALMASRAAARAESVVNHELASSTPALTPCTPTSCASDCAGSGFSTGHRAACDYLRNDLGGQFDPDDWIVSLTPSDEIEARIGWVSSPPVSRFQRTVRVTVQRDPSKRACVACFVPTFNSTGVIGESTYLLHN